MGRILAFHILYTTIVAIITQHSVVLITHLLKKWAGVHIGKNAMHIIGFLSVAFYYHCGADIGHKKHFWAPCCTPLFATTFEVSCNHTRFCMRVSLVFSNFIGWGLRA